MKRDSAVIAFVFCVSFAPSHAHAQFTILQSLPNISSHPIADLTSDGSTLYGVGLARDAFKINADGSGFQTLAPVSGLIDAIYSRLAVDGSNVYGTATGFSGLPGSVFKASIDGSTSQIIHTFDGHIIDGIIDNGRPVGGLTLSGSTLYGTTYSGGFAGFGNIFSLNTDGTGYQLLHSFSLPADGLVSGPTSSLLLDGSTLYGLASGTAGVGGGLGGLFKLSTDGSGFQSWANFPATMEPAISFSLPHANLTLVGSTLYGVANESIFKIQIDGSGFQILHTFGAGVNNGLEAISSLTQIGSELYGTSIAGGAFGGGTIYQIGTDGNGFKVLYSFGTSVDSPEEPYGGMAAIGTTLYGTTFFGGPDNNGTVFSFVVPEPSTFALAALGFIALVARRARRSRHTRSTTWNHPTSCQPPCDLLNWGTSKCRPQSLAESSAARS